MVVVLESGLRVPLKSILLFLGGYTVPRLTVVGGTCWSSGYLSRCGRIVKVN
jgi:hypothetical protein